MCESRRDGANQSTEYEILIIFDSTIAKESGELLLETALPVMGFLIVYVFFHC